MVERQLLFSVTKKDLIRQTFRCPGKGGQNVNKLETGVRWIHEASGARGESVTFRKQHQNEVEAFKRLAATDVFQKWLRVEASRKMGQRVPETAEQIRERVNREVDEGLLNGKVLVEEVLVYGD